MRILLITNYREDKQKSMLRFGNLLVSGLLNENIIVSEIFPKSKIQKFCFCSKLKKWSGYIDKYVIFQKKLESILKKNSFDLIHIIDHSNSVYLPKLSRLSKTPKMTTCHDFIAIRSAAGEFPSAPITSNKGKQLQRWIEKSLKLSDFYACDSLQTQSDLNRRIPESRLRSKVIHLGVERIQSKGFMLNKKLGFDLQTTKYLLHVGSDAWYKNRKGVLEAFKFSCKGDKNLFQKLVFVGPKIQPHERNLELDNWIKINNNKLIFLPNISEIELQSLYTHASLLIFPSFIEGFGWPPLEAHANSCPSVTTKTGAIFEILEDHAIYVNPDNQTELNTAVHDNLIGNNNNKFTKLLPTNEECSKNYAILYEEIIQHSF